ncbi:MAG: sel1 repeat family protein [Bacilli bacterium]|nr:sel1 repeat family protein [Bacilli bacterium]
MYYFNYNVWFAFDSKEYLKLHREGYICATYNKEIGQKLLTELPQLIDNNSPVDLYAYALVLYKNGDRFDKDKAFAIFDKLCDQEYLPAYNAYGVCLFDGICVTKSIPGAIRLFKKASDLGCISSKYNLGYFYLRGIGVDKDIELGKSFIEDAANKGCNNALHALGSFYLQGLNGYPQDYNSAFNYLKQASNHYSAKAASLLADMYLNGLGCTKDIDKAIKEHVHASMLDFVPSQKFLADTYYYGKVTEKNIDRAYSYYLRAAENGDAYSMYSVGYMIVKNEVFWVDKSIGIDWLKKSASLGNEDAEKLLSKL